MPLYEYQAKPDVDGCDYCRDGFAILQRMTEDALATCPKCDSRIDRLIPHVGIATPKTNAELKNLGFTKLVKRDDGVYENVTRTGDESRYMNRGDADSVPDIKKKIGD